MNPKSLHFKITEISIEDVLANDKILYNVNNLWENNNKPLDYSDKSALCNTKNWIYKFHEKADIHEISISNKDIGWLKEASRIGKLTGDFPKMYIEELEDLCNNSNIIIPESENNKGWFIRSETISLKNSKHGTGPYYDLKSIIESLVTSRSGHSCFDRDITDIKLYLIPWKDMNHDKEFRIFVCNNKITAISCQHLYSVNEWLCKSTVSEKEQIIQLILNYFNSNIREKLTFIGSYTMDLVLLDIDGEHLPYFIEPNSFGIEYSSGSSLFHWKIDKDILYGKEQFIEFRYTTN